jgi:hypothetical protein
MPNQILKLLPSHGTQTSETKICLSLWYCPPSKENVQPAEFMYNFKMADRNTGLVIPGHMMLTHVTRGNNKVYEGQIALKLSD